MKCEVCEKDTGDVLVVLPIPRKDGALNTLACLKCAEESSAYCKKHKVPHIRSAGNKTICRQCWCTEGMNIC